MTPDPRAPTARGRRTPDEVEGQIRRAAALFVLLIGGLLALTRAVRGAGPGDWNNELEFILAFLLWLPFLSLILRQAAREVEARPATASPADFRLAAWSGRWFLWTVAHLALAQTLLLALGHSLFATDDGGSDLIAGVNLMSLSLLFFAIFSIVAMLALTQNQVQRRDSDRMALAVELASARLGLLRAQLDPHFVFNGLHSIASLLAERPAEAQTMLRALRELLAQVLETSGRETLPLAEEIGLAEAYARLQTIRFEERLEVRFDIDPGSLSLEVPALILQPLLENSIKHGLKPGHSLRVWISARADRGAGRLLLEVRDDGQGVANPGRLVEGLGLRNTRARLRALYGAAQSFDFSLDADGARAALRLPLVRPRSADPAIAQRFDFSLQDAT